MKFIIATILIGFSAQARVTDNQINFKVENELISLTPKAGYHLNAEAPATAVFDDLEALFKPATKTEKLFTFKKDVKYKNATLKFYVCDDKKTVCEQHEEKVNLKNGESKSAETKSNFSTIENFKLASANGKPTLLVFSAPWCPACIRMMTEVYHKPVVEKQLSKINFVKLNSDLPENSELSEKFKIKAIPTLILLDKNGQEAYRWLDYQPATKFAKSVEAEVKKIDQAAQLAKNAQLGDVVSASQLAHRAFNTLDYAEAVKWFSLTKSAEDQKFKLSSEVSLAQEKSDADEKSADDYVQVLQKAIVLTTSKFDQLRWTIDLFDKKNDLKTFSEESKAKAKTLVNEIDLLIKNPKAAQAAFKESTYGEYGGFENIELMWMKAKLLGLLEMKPEQEKTNQQSIAEISKKNLSVERPGELLLAIGYLKEAGEKTMTENYYKQLVKKFPNSYVYFEKYARFSQKNKNLEQALSLTNEALKYPEGNEPQLKLLKSQILKDLNKNEEAAAVVDSALKNENIQHKRYAGTLKKLNDLKADLAKTK